MTARVEVDVRECVGVVCGCGVCGCIYMSLYCMLDGVRQGRRDI